MQPAPVGRRKDGASAAVPNLKNRQSFHSQESVPLGELSNVSKSNSRSKSTTRDTDQSEERENLVSPQQPSEKPRMTIKELRQAAQEAAQRKSTQVEHGGNSINNAPLAKKKPSLFGGLFQVREPTQVALNQVAAQMIAQHGSTNPAKVPHVRMEKMPDYVPKVNSKWDGLPESIKQRDKRDKDGSKMKKMDSSLFTGLGGARATYDRRNSSSSGSFGSRGRSTLSNREAPNTQFYAPSINSSGDLAMQMPGQARKRAGSMKSQSSSSKSNPESSAGQATDASIEEMPEIPAYLREFIGSHSNQNTSSQDCPPNKAVSGPSSSTRRRAIPDVKSPPTIDMVPDYSMSPIPSPRDNLPLTPSTQQTEEDPILVTNDSLHDQVLLQPSQHSKSPRSKPVQKPLRSLDRAFLADEAQELVLPQDGVTQTRCSDLPLRNWDEDLPLRPGHSSSSANSRKLRDLEKRPNSSRARIGLRASLLVDTDDDDRPWTAQEHQTTSAKGAKPSATSLVPHRPKKSKGFGLFGKERPAG
ncbi:hypothetical protein PV10_01524 [Exophiala mesophila]|uniref:Uncharacterized protein n=1 Tax=Exophiala mesophila TaxID=212818 RepID=A0A0D2AFX0_EXOME|nr:uncharacterized protein PV10_01524 [Exophiala mesophila]KIV97818.1 hypothetical protein PV10_01524 [Exophiala mesophila]